MHVLHLTSSMNWGGLEYRALEQVEWLNQNGHRATLGAHPDSDTFKKAKEADKEGNRTKAIEYLDKKFKTILLKYNPKFGQTYDDYSIMGRPYKINESMANTEIFYAILGRYRMYRRKGIAIATSTEGDTLMRKNALLITAMARYGGQMERGACVAKTSDAEV